MKIFRNGLLTGLTLQLAIGPVFFFIVNLTLQKTIYDGFAAVIAVTLVDFIYIALTIFGAGQLVEKRKIKSILGIISSIVLVLFGAIIIKNVMGMNILFEINNLDDNSILGSFVTTFLLTILSPMTIVFWTSLFATKAIENNYSKRELPLFGLGAGLATFIFMGFAVILFSLLRTAVPIMLMQALNILVGCLLIIYGSSRFIKILINK
jgi:threonine/homoserine/homoserine lactone efflux protein